MAIKFSVSWPQCTIVIINLCLVLSPYTDATSVDGHLMNDQGNKETLELVHVIMRHGQRNPVKSYPNDPYVDEKYWPEGWGELTKTGLNQAFELGQFIRHRYNSFVNGMYKENEISVTSSDSTRTIRSALSALRGLYPSLDYNDKNCSTQQFQIVPLRTVPAKQDNFLMMSQFCARFDKEFGKHLEVDKFEKVNNKHWLDKINDGSGLNSTSLNGTLMALDNIEAQTHMNRTLPAWATPDIVKFIKEYIPYWLKMELGNNELKKLRSFIIQQIISNMKMKHEDKMKKKMIIYSAHDRTIVAIFQLLNLPLYFRPPHASAVFIELHKDPNFNDHHIQILYRNTTEKEPFKLSIPNCDSPCFLNRLEQVLKPLFFENYGQECKLSTTEISSLSNSASSFVTNILITTPILIYLVNCY